MKAITLMSLHVRATYFSYVTYQS